MNRLNGIWYNELGSKMILVVHGNMLSGTYQTAVGDAEGIYQLSGQVNTCDDQSKALGWIVVWNNKYHNSDSVTAWSGQFQPIDAVDTIVTTWLLTRETSPDEDWGSTLVGKDVFTKRQPTDDDIRAKSKSGVVASFPKK